MGWLTRQAGLTIDNLVSVEIVLADGRILRASATENPDLFWAVRGGGGNFGVVTEFEFRLHEVGPMIDFGLLFWGEEQAGDALRLLREVVPELPRSLNVMITVMTAPPAPFIPSSTTSGRESRCCSGASATPRSTPPPCRRCACGLPPLFEHVSPMPYVALQQMLDEGNAAGQHYYEKSTYVDDLTDGVADVLADHSGRRTSPMSIVFIYRLDQAFCEADESTPRSVEPARRSTPSSVSPQPDAGSCRPIGSGRARWDGAATARRGVGTYVNAMTEYEERRVRAAYGDAKYERLKQIKAAYDERNVFHRNINIKPA